MKDESTAFTGFLKPHNSFVWENLPLLYIHGSQQTVCLSFTRSWIQFCSFFNYFFDVQLEAECYNWPIMSLAFAGTMSWLRPQRQFLGFNESPSSSINRCVRACCGCNEVVIFLSLCLSHSADSCPWLHAVSIFFMAFFS